MAREALPAPLLPLSHRTEVPTPFLPAIPLTAYGPMAAAAAAAAVVRGTGEAIWGAGGEGDGGQRGLEGRGGGHGHPFSEGLTYSFTQGL